MTRDDVLAICAQLPGAVEDYPFGDGIAVFKVGGRMFALVPLARNTGSVNLKCDPDLAVELRDRYPAVRPGYHQNKRHWNTVELDGSIDSDEIRWMVEHSYELVLRRLPALTRAALRGNSHHIDNGFSTAPHSADDAGMATTRRADMFTEDGNPSDDDPREHRQRMGDERATLVESLRCQRLTLELKCAGLDAEEMARRAVEPSTMSLLGLVRHLAEVERATFRRTMAGQDVPRLFCSPADRDGDFDGAVADPRVVAEAWDAWRAEVDFATQFVADAPSLDITADDPLNQHGSGGGQLSLREVLVGMIEEYARHMGHVDLLRERIDGRLGQ